MGGCGERGLGGERETFWENVRFLLKTLKFGPIIISCDGMFFVCSRFFVVVFFVMSLACAFQLRHCVPISFRCCVCLCLPCFDMYI